MLSQRTVRALNLPSKGSEVRGIPHLAIGDLFLIAESEYMIHPLYAKHIAVISEAVASFLVQRGVSHKSIYVTGNPAFDNLAVIMKDKDRRQRLRHKLGMTGKKVILFPAPSSKINTENGRPFADIIQTVRQLEHFCNDNPDHAFIIRQHPSAALTLPELLNGYHDDGSLITAEEAILIADIICVEVSTMGLQAALIGKPVFIINFSDHFPLPKYGLAEAVNSLSEALLLIKSGHLPKPKISKNEEVGNATQRVISCIDRIRSNPEIN